MYFSKYIVLIYHSLRSLTTTSKICQGPRKDINLSVCKCLIFTLVSSSCLFKIRVSVEITYMYTRTQKLLISPRFWFFLEDLKTLHWKDIHDWKWCPASLNEKSKHWFHTSEKKPFKQDDSEGGVWEMDRKDSSIACRF